MQTRRRRHHSPPPWERRSSSPNHPVGQARRRWPRAHDGGLPERPRVNARYRRAYDGDQAHTERRRGTRQRGVSQFQRMRQSPVRNGLIGLAIAGVSAPIAVNTYQEALRTDPSHERISATDQHMPELDDMAVMRAWQAMATENAEANVELSREAVIQEKVDRFKQYRLTQQMAADIFDAATEAGIDLDVAFGLVRAESSFRNTATSPVGATGLTQLMPRTAAWMEPGIKPSDLRNQQTNLRIGFKYLNYLKDKYKGDTNLALLAYNRGPGTVDRAIRQGKNPDNGYAKFVMGEENHGHRLFTNR